VSFGISPGLLEMDNGTAYVLIEYVLESSQQAVKGKREFDPLNYSSKNRT
jgi:hypothetical protein